MELRICALLNKFLHFSDLHQVQQAPPTGLLVVPHRLRLLRQDDNPKANRVSNDVLKIERFVRPGCNER